MCVIFAIFQLKSEHMDKYSQKRNPNIKFRDLPSTGAKFFIEVGQTYMTYLIFDFHISFVKGPKNEKSTSQRTQSLSITKAYWLRQYREVCVVKIIRNTQVCAVCGASDVRQPVLF